MALIIQHKTYTIYYIIIKLYAITEIIQFPEPVQLSNYPITRGGRGKFQIPVEMWH